MEYKSLILKNWQYRQQGTIEWKHSVPGACTQIHSDLLENEEIPDPFINRNETEVQWVGERVWEYRVLFEADASLQAYRNNVIVFEGLDTFATIKLNGEQILSTDNMFCEYRVLVNDLLRYGEDNTLEITFDSALLVARRLEKEKGKFVCWNGETCRLHIRKAPYHFGWDWGPVLMTCGPYKPVRLISYDSFIEDFYVRPSFEAEDVLIDVQLSVVAFGTCRARVTITDPDGNKSKEINFADITSGVHSRTIRLESPQLWYPWTIGTPHLYSFKIELMDNEGVIQVLQDRIGLRKVELVQEPMQQGTSFYFKLNGVPIYCGGSNWIPAHSLLTKLTREDYTSWLLLAVDGNQSMIRVWGGGFYEDDFFYSECDRLGLLVWQDFMFACGQYPGDAGFISMIEDEATHQLKRLRNHACLALFAGNNEDYQIAELYKLTWDREDHSGDYSNTNFPARTIYEVTLPEKMKALLPDVPYHPGSPWSGEKPTTDATVGDLHQWNVWHGTQEKYQDWHKLGGRFVSEFGMEALPTMKTYEDCITEPSQMFPQSEYVDHHNKADGFERRLALYVVENIRVTSMDMRAWIYATQLMQAECLSYAYRSWRREWNKPGERKNGGALVWQLNDCWPVASWAIVDFYRRPKLGYYAVKRELRAVAIGLLRKETGQGREQTVEVWGVNSSLEERRGKVIVDVYDVHSGEKQDSLSAAATFAANETTEIFSSVQVDSKCVVHARLVSADGDVCSASDWPQPLKYLLMPDRNVQVKVDGSHITVCTNKPVKGVELITDSVLTDNGFDLFPESPVMVAGLKPGAEVGVRYYLS